MARRRLLITAVTSVSSFALAGAGLAGPAWAAAGQGAADVQGQACSAGAHTLSPPGAHVYPETGNGGYTSVHTDVHLVYDATANKFLPGNHVMLTDRATQCLTSFSLDFERKSANTADGPDMTVNSVTVNGRAAAFRFVQPTYPGDPNGQDDPSPQAHEASQNNPVGGPENNPLPPACSPELPDTDAAANSLNGQQCPANKLVITPKTPIRDGSVFTVKVSYTGKPGVHNDGDGTTEGWFRSSDGGFVTTEPVGSEDWMPLNDYPTAKPTYDFYDTVSAGKTGVANGVLESVTRHAPDAQFPGGSATWHWHSRAPIASYLVEDSVGSYTLTSRTGSDGIRYYQAQDASISADQQQQNLAIMNQQQDITDFESQFNGPFPFTSDGIIIGTPEASFEEEMQTMITFAGGQIDLGTLYHENMHQWWGDNVTEGALQPDLLQGGHGHPRRGPAGRARRRDQGRGPRHRRGQEGVPGQPDRAVQQDVRPGRQLLDKCAVQPDPVQPVCQRRHLRAARRRVHRRVADPRHRQVHQGPAADPAPLRRRPHHRSPARSRLPALAAQQERGLRKQAQPVLHPVVRHRLPERRRRQQARHHRARADRCRLLRRQRRLPRVARGPQEARRRVTAPLSRAMASRSAAASGRCSTVSDSTGPLNQCPRGHRIFALSSAPSVEFIR